MAKSKPQITLQSFGIYSHWDKDSKSLPQITQFTTQVKAELDVEFGLIVNIKKSQRRKTTFLYLPPRYYRYQWRSDAAF